jgi:hypothetical protein
MVKARDTAGSEHSAVLADLLQFAGDYSFLLLQSVHLGVTYESLAKLTTEFFSGVDGFRPTTFAR